MNVIFIVLDTVRKDRIGTYNSDIEFTPHIDSLAEDSIVFEEAIAQAPWTLPSHGSIFSGQYPWEHSATQKNITLETDRPTLAERFRDSGHTTACYTTNPWISSYTGLTDGFEEVNNYIQLGSDTYITLPDRLLETARSLLERLGLYQTVISMGDSLWQRILQGDDSVTSRSTGTQMTETIVSDATDFIREQRSQDQPHFLFLNFMTAHFPYKHPDKYNEKHAPDVDPTAVQVDPRDVDAEREDPDFDVLSRIYDASIDYLDDQLGDLLTFLKDENALEDTVIVVTADHGENMGENGRYGHQFSVAEPLINVPLIVHHPDHAAEQQEGQVELRSLYDLLPAYAGLDEQPDDITVERAKGGYADPQYFLPQLPEQRQEELGQSLRFVRSTEKKLIREKDGDDIRYRMIDLDSGDMIDVEQDFLDELEGTTAKEGTTVEQAADEKVKDRLRDLGYM